MFLSRISIHLKLFSFIIPFSSGAYSETSFPGIIKLIDQVSSKGIIHKNKANNKKSKLALHLNNK